MVKHMGDTKQNTVSKQLGATEIRLQCLRVHHQKDSHDPLRELYRIQYDLKGVLN
jgi:hypothetical protein